MTRHLVVFAKPPLSGVAKTRLAADLGPDTAAAVARALLLDTLMLCERVAAASDVRRPTLVVAYAEGGDWLDQLIPRHWHLIPQRGGDLGERLEHALADLGPAEEDQTVFIGMDAPHLSPELLLAAWEHLNLVAAVLGPCEDGGFYLMGVRGQLPSGSLREIRWSTSNALADTREALERCGLGCWLLPTGYDVDDLPALCRLIGDLPALAPDSLAHTRAILRELRLSRRSADAVT